MLHRLEVSLIAAQCVTQHAPRALCKVCVQFSLRRSVCPLCASRRLPHLPAPILRALLCGALLICAAVLLPGPSLAASAHAPAAPGPFACERGHSRPVFMHAASVMGHDQKSPRSCA